MFGVRTSVFVSSFLGFLESDAIPVSALVALISVPWALTWTSPSFCAVSYNSLANTLETPAGLSSYLSHEFSLVAQRARTL